MATVKMYTTPTCVYCKMAEDFFAKHSVKYEEYNVAEDEKARDEMIAKSHQLGVPVIDVDGEIFIGFDQRGLSRALKIAG
ncbi:MAG: glutaredoxin family protein [Patescibacteria group bacterium]